MFFNLIIYFGKEGKSVHRKHFPVFLNTEFIFNFQFLNYEIPQGIENKEIKH